MDAWVRYQVGLKVGKIDVEGTVESQGGSDGRNDLSDDRSYVKCSSCTCSSRRWPHCRP